MSNDEIKSDEQIHDPDLYARMCEPHPDADAATAAYKAFFAEVSAARERHRIRDVVVVSTLSLKADDGSVATGVLYGNRGDLRLVSTMLAHALGHARAAEQSRLDEIAGVNKQKRAVKGRAKR